MLIRKRLKWWDGNVVTFKNWKKSTCSPWTDLLKINLFWCLSGPCTETLYLLCRCFWVPSCFSWGHLRCGWCSPISDVTDRLWSVRIQTVRRCIILMYGWFSYWAFTRILLITSSVNSSNIWIWVIRRLCQLSKKHSELVVRITYPKKTFCLFSLNLVVQKDWGNL